VPVETPYPGIKVWRTEPGYTVLKLHYQADPRKDQDWRDREYRRMNDDPLWRQEQEIDFSAQQGQLVYHQFNSEAALEDEFEVPSHWTKYYGLDPHPAVPHAHLWGAMDPWGDLWFYRELWPSKVSFKYEDGKKLGKPGNVPEDDNRFTIKQYVETIKWLESEENWQNEQNGKPFAENIYQRVIDFTARAFDKATVEDPTRVNYQSKYEMFGRELEIDMNFQDAKKDHGAGEEMVNEWLKPREVEISDGTFKRKSRIRIMKQRCPELIYQIQNLRRKQLTPQQASVMDPTGKPLEKRNHLTDLMRYIIMAEPVYLGDAQPEDSWNPNRGGVAY
jgi:hypothetical protein